jgi:hypothetical protein
LNYFAHGFRFVDRPYFLAGTAIPDALGALNRRVRVRRQSAERFLDDCDPVVADVAAGIVQHHDDDKWFHGQRAFAELSLAFGQEIRGQLCDEKGLRASFLGHVIVELLLDAELIARQPAGADPYYQAVALIDGALLEQIVNRMANQPARRLDEFLGMFTESRFLEDYADDQHLLLRLNQVMRRVGLDSIDARLIAWLPSARGRVVERFAELLPPDPPVRTW